MPRRAVIAVAVVLFLAFSVELARYLTASGNERTEVLRLLDAEARGDVAGVVGLLDGCEDSPACTKLVARQVPRLRHAGDAKILLLESKTAYKLKSSTGVTRVAWATLDPAGPTRVQCVTVHKKWSFVGGASTSLRSISAPIGLEESC